MKWRIRILAVVTSVVLIASCAAQTHHNNISIAQANIKLAMAYYFGKIGQQKMADKAYRQTIHLAPHLGAAHNNYAVFLCRHGYYRQALQQFSLAVHEPSYLKKELAKRNAGLCEFRKVSSFKLRCHKSSR